MIAELGHLLAFLALAFASPAHAASPSCDAVNAGAFNLTNPALDLGRSALLTNWAVGEQLGLTISDATGRVLTDGFFHGPLTLAGFGPLEQVTIPANGSNTVLHTIVAADLTNGILVDPENNHSITAVCVPPPVPNVTAVDPDRGPSGGGTSVTITGINFLVTGGAAATAVSFGPTPAASFTVVDATQIIATSRAAKRSSMGR